jgi:FtsH-binding integral membrane protein
MNVSANPYDAPRFTIAADAAADERSDFIAKTYAHLVGAIGVLVVLEFFLLQTGLAEQFVQVLGKSQYSWLIVLGAFMAVSWIANSWASSSTSMPMQYAGLGLYVLAQAFILLPLLWMANQMDKGIIPTAGLATLVLFGVLTTIVFVTRKDFSFMRSILMFGGFAAMGLIACAILFQFSLGPIFTYVMIAFACGYILYDTSNILHHYRIGQHVAASLALFASVALMFWYILRLFMASRD